MRVEPAPDGLGRRPVGLRVRWGGELVGADAAQLGGEGPDRRVAPEQCRDTLRRAGEGLLGGVAKRRPLQPLY